MFSVQHLKTLYVLQLNTIRQRFSLEVNVWELWECSGCIWDVSTQDTHIITILQKVMCAYKIFATTKMKPLHYETHPGIAGTVEPVCWCLPVLTLAAAVAAGLHLLMCHWSSLQLCVLASTWKECSVIHWTVTSDPHPDQDPDTFSQPWTATYWCGSEVTAMEKWKIDYSSFWAEKNPKPVMTLWLHSHC